MLFDLVAVTNYTKMKQSSGHNSLVWKVQRCGKIHATVTIAAENRIPKWRIEYLVFLALEEKYVFLEVSFE